MSRYAYEVRTLDIYLRVWENISTHIYMDTCIHIMIILFMLDKYSYKHIHVMTFNYTCNPTDIVIQGVAPWK